MKLAIASAGWLGLAFLSATLTPSTAHWTPPAVGASVNTSSGPVSGHAARNRTQVSEYLGIPYAQPPVGQLRFAPPQAYTSSQPFNASSYSPGCPANPAKPTLNYPNHTAQEPKIVAHFATQDGTSQSEDCLTLNIWSKASRKWGKPVLVWFYGGRTLSPPESPSIRRTVTDVYNPLAGFNIGNTNTPFYDGQYLADAQDVIVVTLNYRVNIFGFSGVPSLPQNAGLLDQRLAVEWVRDNIAGFGGDPTKITLFGQSAGGASVDYWSYAWRHDPIVHGLISESGTAQSFQPNSAAQSAQAFYNASKLLNCTGTGPSDPSVLSCVRSKNTTALLAALARVPAPPTRALPAPPFQPTVDNVTVFANYSALATAGAFAPLPYLAGNNDEEFGYYAISVFAANKTFTTDQINLFNLEAFTCPTAAETAARAQHDVPVWRYRYFGDWPNLRLYPNSSAYHGSEIGLVYGTAADITGLPNTPEEDAVSAYMMKAWATFAEDPQKGLSECLAWPEYDPKKQTLVRLAYQDQTNASFVYPIVYDAQCAALGGNQSSSQGAF